MSIRDRMQADLTSAMKVRDSSRVTVLRCALAAVANAEAVDASAFERGVTEVERRALTEADIAAVVAAERAELVSSAEERRGLGRPHDAEELLAQAAVLAAYLADSVGTDD